MRISDWSSDVALPISADKIDLTDSWYEWRTYFYVPKVANPGTTTSNYDKYRITSSTSDTSYNGGVVQRQTSTNISTDQLPGVNEDQWSNCYAVPVSGYSQVTITISGNFRADLYVYSTNDCSGW